LLSIDNLLNKALFTLEFLSGPLRSGRRGLRRQGCEVSSDSVLFRKSSVFVSSLIRSPFLSVAPTPSPPKDQRHFPKILPRPATASRKVPFPIVVFFDRLPPQTYSPPLLSILRSAPICAENTPFSPSYTSFERLVLTTFGDIVYLTTLPPSFFSSHPVSSHQKRGIFLFFGNNFTTPASGFPVPPLAVEYSQPASSSNPLGQPFPFKFRSVPSFFSVYVLCVSPLPVPSFGATGPRLLLFCLFFKAPILADSIKIPLSQAAL